MDLWGKPITAAGAQSIDGKSTYVLLRLAGDIGQIQANESVDAVRDIVAKDPPPQGLKVYVSGAAPLASDTLSHRELQPEQHHDRHDLPDHRDAAARLPLADHTC